MPTAAAVAAAAATAKIQAMEAVTNTAAVFGLTKESTSPGLSSGTAQPLGGTSPSMMYGLSPIGKLSAPTTPQGVSIYVIN